MDATEQFRREVALGDGAALDRLALLIASHGTPGGLDIEFEQGRLDELAADFGGGSPAELMGWLGIRGFRGNAEAYYDPDNSYLNRVLDRGLGIPITLSVLAIELGRRCGIELVGIGLPGEFIVAERDHPDCFHNPFRHRSMNSTEVDDLVRRFAGPNAGLTPEMRRPVGAVSIAARMLANLAHIFAHTDQPADLEWVLGLQTSLPGAPPQLRRQRVANLAQLGRFWDASAVLVELMDDPGAPATPDEREADEAMLRQLRGHFN